MDPVYSNKTTTDPRTHMANPSDITNTVHPIILCRTSIAGHQSIVSECEHARETNHLHVVMFTNPFFIFRLSLNLQMFLIYQCFLHNIKQPTFLRYSWAVTEYNDIVKNSAVISSSSYKG